MLLGADCERVQSGQCQWSSDSDQRTGLLDTSILSVHRRSRGIHSHTAAAAAADHQLSCDVGCSHDVLVLHTVLTTSSVVVHSRIMHSSYCLVT